MKMPLVMNFVGFFAGIIPFFPAALGLFQLHPVLPTAIPPSIATMSHKSGVREEIKTTVSGLAIYEAVHRETKSMVTMAQRTDGELRF